LARANGETDGGFLLTRRLPERFYTTGVDISGVELVRARGIAPRARFIRADFPLLEFPHVSTVEFDRAVRFRWIAARKQSG
jgi:hypothetical protein